MVDYCRWYSDLAAQITILRDRGIALSEIQPAVIQAIGPAVVAGDPVLRGMVSATLAAVYNNPALTPLTRVGFFEK